MQCAYRVLRRQGLMTTPNSQCALNALAIDNPIGYARLALTGEMQDWVNAEDNLEVILWVDCYVWQSTHKIFRKT